MRSRPLLPIVVLCLAALFGPEQAPAEETAPPLELQPLIDEALQNNHEIWVSGAKWKAATFRTTLAGSLPDPMLMIGYQNEGWDRYTFGKMEGAQWMYSVSQMFPFPGKRSLKEEMAGRDADTAAAMHGASKLGTVARVKELYFDLFLAYKDLDIVRERTVLFGQIEEAALARYATGMAQQQEVLMAQTEKYMLLEREAMLNQKVRSLDAMLIAAVGREESAPLGRPAERAATDFAADVDDLVRQALERSPEIRSRQKMLAASQTGVHMAQKEYYPDVTLTGTVGKRSGEFEDMWSITATFNIPLWFRSRQSQALAEARAMSLAADHELAGVRTMVASTVRDNYAMLRSSEQLMDLYRQGLIPKSRQDFELALAGYRTGRVEGITVVSRLKALLDFEIAYWTQFTEREKAIARIEALTGGETAVSGQEPGARSQE
jgi:outer membrane protein TolC